jgi:hypothetical protein
VGKALDAGTATGLGPPPAVAMKLPVSLKPITALLLHQAALGSFCVIPETV